MEILSFLYSVKLRVSNRLGGHDTDINRESALGINGNIDLEFINRGLTLTTAEIGNWKYNTLKIFTGLFKDIGINDLYPEIKISQRSAYKLISTNKVESYVDFFIRPLIRN